MDDAILRGNDDGFGAIVAGGSGERIIPLGTVDDDDDDASDGDKDDDDDDAV